jgi:hypothetical protein
MEFSHNEDAPQRARVTLAAKWSDGREKGAAASVLAGARGGPWGLPMSIGGGYETATKFFPFLR